MRMARFGYLESSDLAIIAEHRGCSRASLSGILARLSAKGKLAADYLLASPEKRRMMPIHWTLKNSCLALLKWSDGNQPTTP